MNKVFDWIKTHKKEIIIYTGVAAFGGGIIYYLLKDPECAGKAIKLIQSKTENNVTNPLSSEEYLKKIAVCSETKTLNTVPRLISYAETEPFVVSGHIRNLPKGRRASPAKCFEAEELGILLQEGQTFVNEFTKCGK